MMTLVSVLLVGQLMAGTQGAPAATPAPLATPCAVAAPNRPASSCPTQSPKKIGAVVTAGVTLDKPSFAASLRVRYFGPRLLDQAGDAFSAPSTLLSAQIGKSFGAERVTFDIFNLLNSDADDVEYYYGSWLPHDAANAALASDPAVNPALGGRRRQ